MATAGQYRHASEPRAVQDRQKFRPQAPGGGIMTDRRVVRGNTYSANVLANQQQDPVELQREQEARRRRQRAKQQAAAQAAQAARPPMTPEPVDGRQHMEIQTENYLEEITDRVVEQDVTTQTDAFMDRPPTPLYVPKKTGVDAETQIYEGDLFDFDLEVEPILEVLIGKTLEQGMMEVMEEEELANMRAHQEEFIELRNAELAETQRMEAAEKRRYEEKERRLRQERERQQREREENEVVAAREFAKSYLSSLEGAVFNNLSDTGFFHDPVLKEVENDFLPWLTPRIEAHINRAVVGRKLADHVITHAFEIKKEKRRAALKDEDEKEAARKEALRVAEVKRVAAEKKALEFAEAERKRKEEEEAARLAAEAAGSDEDESD